MHRWLASDKRGRSNEAQLHFALGRAYEQRQQYAQAFTHYAEGNALRRLDASFDIEGFERRCARIRSLFSAEFFAARAGAGDTSPAPIFIVGLPRSGSTLIEQILASHSHVEGTTELPNILILVGELDDMAPRRNAYPEVVATLPAAELAGFGSRYLAETAPLRRGSERFTDKQPNNFSHIGLIHAILPRATIIDARRHPMDACFSTFKQHFAEGQAFSYDLASLGRYYRAYRRQAVPGGRLDEAALRPGDAPHPRLRRGTTRAGDHRSSSGYRRNRSSLLKATRRPEAR